MRELPHQLIEFKSIPVQREFCGNVEAERYVAPLRELNLLPVEVPDVGSGAGRWSIEVQQEFEFLPVELEWNPPVVDGSATVAKHQATDPKMEQRLTPGTVRCLNFR